MTPTNPTVYCYNTPDNYCYAANTNCASGETKYSTAAVCQAHVTNSTITCLAAGGTCQWAIFNSNIDLGNFDCATFKSCYKPSQNVTPNPNPGNYIPSINRSKLSGYATSSLDEHLCYKGTVTTSIQDFMASLRQSLGLFAATECSPGGSCLMAVDDSTVKTKLNDYYGLKTSWLYTILSLGTSKEQFMDNVGICVVEDNNNFWNKIVSTVASAFNISTSMAQIILIGAIGLIAYKFASGRTRRIM